jgi:hypothetical protein
MLLKKSNKLGVLAYVYCSNYARGIDGRTGGKADPW